MRTPAEIAAKHANLQARFDADALAQRPDAAEAAFYVRSHLPAGEPITPAFRQEVLDYLATFV